MPAPSPAARRDAGGGSAAVRELEEALRRDPQYARVLAALANVLSWQAAFRYMDADSGFARAYELATRALAITPMVEAHLVLARHAEMVAWDTAAADEHYRQALEINPRDPRTPYNNHAITLIAAERLADAQDAYENGLRVSPEDPVLLGNLANLMARQQRWDDALAYLDRALVRTPDDMQTLALRTPGSFNGIRHHPRFVKLLERLER